MITLRRNAERRHVNYGKQDVWHSFSAQDYPGQLSDSFGFLVAFDEIQLPRGESTKTYSDDDLEIVRYIHKGALSQEDTAGNSGVIQAGEFQRMSTGRRIRYKETSVSRSDRVHMFRISLRPSEVGIDRNHEQKRFTAAERRNLLCVIASPDGRQGSLRINQEALVCSSILDIGHHTVYPLKPGRSAWLHLIYGEATLHDMILTQGDGVGVTNEPSVSLTVQENTEMLLIDLAEPD